MNTQYINIKAIEAEGLVERLRAEGRDDGMVLGLLLGALASALIRSTRSQAEAKRLARGVGPVVENCIAAIAEYRTQSAWERRAAGQPPAGTA